jgi:hypothetical protein
MQGNMIATLIACSDLIGRNGVRNKIDNQVWDGVMQDQCASHDSIFQVFW